MAQKIMIEFGTKIDTASTIAAAKKMQEIIQNSSTGGSMKTSAEAQLRLAEGYAKKIEAINNKRKISQNDFNDLKMYTNLMNDSSSKIGDIYSKAGASLSAEMSKALAELTQIQSKSQAAIRSIKTVYGTKAGVSFQNTPEHLRVGQVEIDNLKANKDMEIQKASDKMTIKLDNDNKINQQSIDSSKITQNKILSDFNVINNTQFASYQEFMNNKKRLDDEFASRSNNNKRVDIAKEQANQKAILDMEEQRVNQTRIDQDRINAIRNDTSLIGGTREKTKLIKALEIPGVTGVATGKDLSNNETYQKSLETINNIEKYQREILADIINQNFALGKKIQGEKETVALLEAENKLQQDLLKKQQSSSTSFAGKVAGAGVIAGQKVDSDVQKMEAKQQQTQTLFTAAGLAASTVQLNSQNESLVKNSDITKIATKDEKVGAAATDEATRKNEAANAERLRTNGLMESSGKQFEKLNLKEKMFGKMTDSIGRTLTRVTSAFFLFYKARQMVGKAVSTLTTLDNEMTQIGIVTNKTGEEVWSNFSMFNKLALDLSTTTANYLKGAKIFYQQGLSTTEVISMVAATTKIAALSEVDFAEASKTLTAAIRGYNMETSQAAAVTDKLAAVGAASAADFHELSVAMEKVSAAAYTAGMSFDSLMGVLAKGIETSREAPEAYLNRELLKSVA